MYEELNNQNSESIEAAGEALQEGRRIEVNRYDMGHIPQEPEKKTGKSRGFFKKMILGLVVCLFLGLCIGTGIYAVSFVKDHVHVSGSFKIGDITFGDEPGLPEDIEEKAEIAKEDAQPPKVEANKSSSEKEAIKADTLDSAGITMMDATQVVEKAMPSLVAITNKYVEQYQSFWGEIGEYQGESAGSGIIVGENDEELLIVTNSHVINKAEELTVQFVDGTTADAAVKGDQSAQDLAIIAVRLVDLSDETRDAIAIAKLGNSDELKLGEPAIAIGNAMGYGQSVTSGIISATDRDFVYENLTRKVIQTDAAINPGNSGGALLNSRGEVIGINEAKYNAAAVEGVGYAIPISSAIPIIDEMMNKTTRMKVDDDKASFLGISGADVTDDVSKMYGMPKGVYVAQVTEGSAADKYGLTKGDIITDFDGESVSSMSELKKVMEYYPAGTEVELKIQRVGQDGYEAKAIRVVLDKKEVE